MRKRTSVLPFARVGLDVDVGCALMEGVDDDFVDELDDLVVLRLIEAVRLYPFQLAVFREAIENVSDVAGVGHTPPVEEVEIAHELAPRRDAINDLALGKDVIDDSRTAHALRIARDDDDPVLRVLDGEPLILFQVAAIADEPA